MTVTRKSELKSAGIVYLCHGADEHRFTPVATTDSPWIGHGVSLHRESGDPDLPATFSPEIAIFHPFLGQGPVWTINCPAQPADAPVQTFQLGLRTEFTSTEYPVKFSVGHHRLAFVEYSGHEKFVVMEFNEKATLEAKEISYYTREAMPFPAEWKKGDEVLQSANPDEQGWVESYTLMPAVPGLHHITLNAPSLYYAEGVVRHPMPVHVLEKTPWNNDAELHANGEPEPEVLDRGVVFTIGNPLTLSLMNQNLLLKDSLVSLHSTDAKTLGLVFDPDLGEALSMDGSELAWAMSSPTSAKIGLFKMQMRCSRLHRDWEITGHVLSAEMKDHVTKVEVHGSEISDLGALFYSGEARQLKVTFDPSLRGLFVELEPQGDEDMIYDPQPGIPQQVPENGELEWTVTGGSVSKVFTLKVVCDDVETPLEIPSRVLSKITKDQIESLKINGDLVDLDDPKFLFYRADTVTVELVPKDGSALIGTLVALKQASGEALGMSYDPQLDEPKPLLATGMTWTISGGANQSGAFELLFDFVQVEQSFPVACALMSRNINDEVIGILVGGVALPEGGLRLWRNEPVVVAVDYVHGSPADTLALELEATVLTGSPTLVVTSNGNNTWSVKAHTQSGTFKLELTAPGMTGSRMASCSVISRSANDEVEGILVGGSASVTPMFWRDEAQSVTLKYRANSPFPNFPAELTATPLTGLNPGNLTVTGGTDHAWEVRGSNQSGTFRLSVTGEGMTVSKTLDCDLLSRDLTHEVKAIKLEDLDFPTNAILKRGVPQTLSIEYFPNSPASRHPLTWYAALDSGLISGDVVFSQETSPVTQVTASNRSGTLRIALKGTGFTAGKIAPQAKVLGTLQDEVEDMLLDETPFTGNAPWLWGESRTVTLKYHSDSPLKDTPVALVAVAHSGLAVTDVVVDKISDNPHQFTVKTLQKSGEFGLELRMAGSPSLSYPGNTVMSDDLGKEGTITLTPDTGNLFFRDVLRTLVFTPNQDSPITRRRLTLKCATTGPLLPQNINSIPPFDSPQMSRSWALSGKSQSGIFSVSLEGEGMSLPITLNLKLFSSKLEDEATFKVDGENVSPPVVFKVGTARELSLVPTGPISGELISLNFKSGAGVEAKDFTVSPVGWGVDKPNEYKWDVTSLKSADATFAVEFKAKNLPEGISPVVFHSQPETVRGSVLVSFNGETFRQWDDRVNFPVRGAYAEVTIKPQGALAIGKAFSWSINAPGINPRPMGMEPSFNQPQNLTEAGLLFKVRLDGNDADFSLVFQTGTETVSMPMQLAYHAAKYFLRDISLGSSIGNIVKLRTQSVSNLGAIHYPGAKITWRGPGGILGQEFTDELGNAELTVNKTQHAWVSVETYIRGVPHSVKKYTF